MARRGVYELRREDPDAHAVVVASLTSLGTGFAVDIHYFTIRALMRAPTSLRMPYLNHNAGAY